MKPDKAYAKLAVMSGKPTVSEDCTRLADVSASAIRSILALSQGTDVISLAGGIPASEYFDHSGLGATLSRAVADPTALQYCMSEGEPTLRDALAQRSAALDIPATADDLVITTGSQQALDLIITALIRPGDVVAVERPCYPAIIQLLALADARVVEVDTDCDGLRPDALEAIMRDEHPKLLYACPTFQNPTGATWPLQRRMEVVEMAQRSDMWVIEDDAYRELWYDTPPAVPLARLLPDRVVYVSTFSKVLAPGLRLGWLRCTEPLRNTIVAIKQMRDLNTSTLVQRAIATYIVEGRLDRHIDFVRPRYAERLSAALEVIPDVLPTAEWSRPAGGMYVWLTVPGINTDALVVEALRAGVAFVPGSACYARCPSTASLRIAVAHESPARIEAGLATLGRAIDAQAEHAQSRHLSTPPRLAALAGKRPNAD